MSDERPSEVLGGLSRTRPHRRSQKRAAAPAIAAEPTATADPGPGQTKTPAARPDVDARAARPAPAPAKPPAARAPDNPSAPAPTPLAAQRTSARGGTTRRTPASAPGATKRATPSASRVRQPAQPPGTPLSASSKAPVPAGRADLLGSAVHVTAELAELGISAGARALRGVVARLPKP